jgi:uncharacterized tellurite resistance protein B-like protein
MSKHVNLGRKHAERLRRVAEFLGVSESEVVRRAIDEMAGKYEML